MAKQYTDAELKRAKEQHVALVPTLSLFPYEERKGGGDREDEAAVLRIVVDQLRAYFQAGGTILFGTDVGYTQLYETTSEFEYMARAGMSWRDILASLTTNPSTFFRERNERGSRGARKLPGIGRPQFRQRRVYHSSGPGDLPKGASGTLNLV